MLTLSALYAICALGITVGQSLSGIGTKWHTGERGAFVGKLCQQLKYRVSGFTESKSIGFASIAFGSPYGEPPLPIVPPHSSCGHMVSVSAR